MSKNYGPKTIDIAVTEFDGVPLHEPIEPYESNVIAYRNGDREGALSYHADVAGMMLGCTALEGLGQDKEAQLHLADYVAACAWATSWQYMRSRSGVARSPRYLPQLGPLGSDTRPDSQKMVAAGVHTLQEAKGDFITLLTAADDFSVGTRQLLSVEGEVVRKVSTLSGEGALALACARTADQIIERPELKCSEVQEELKAAAIELTPQVREIASSTGTLPEFRGLAESDSDISRHLRINKSVPLIVRRVVETSREKIRDQFPQLT